MGVNFYNTITVRESVSNQTVEQPFSIANKLDQWGTKLVKPYQKNYGGHSYTIHVKEEMASEEPTPPMGINGLSLIEKIKVFCGVLLKKLAALLDSNINKKYLLIDQIFGPKIKFGDLLPVTPKAQVEKAGNPNDCNCNSCCPCIK